MYEIRIEDHFAAAHFLRNYKGKCEHLHGHNWQIEVMLGGRQLNSEGMLIDFRDARAILSEVLDKFDHGLLNDRPPFDEMNPTTENLSRCIFHQVQKRLPKGVRVRHVTCWETPGCFARYSEDDSEES